jgi:carbonic anhydrase
VAGSQWSGSSRRSATTIWQPGNYGIGCPRAHSKSPDTRALINARDLLPDYASYFRYSGSLTTPPCSEQVSWMVLQKPLQFSEAQIAKLHCIIGLNSRPAQVRNSRYLPQSVGG